MGLKDLWKMQMNWVLNFIDSRELFRFLVYGKVVGLRLFVDRLFVFCQFGGDREFYCLLNVNNWFVQNIYKFLEMFILVLLRKDNVWCVLFGRIVDGNWENGLEGFKWKILSVVVRLMGFEDLLNFDLVSNVEVLLRMFFMEYYFVF